MRFTVLCPAGIIWVKLLEKLHYLEASLLNFSSSCPIFAAYHYFKGTFMERKVALAKLSGFNTTVETESIVVFGSLDPE